MPLQTLPLVSTRRELPATIPDTQAIETALDTMSTAPTFSTSNSLITVVSANAVSSRSEVDRAYNLSEGTPFGLMMGHRFYEYDDPYVTGNEIRRACTGSLIQSTGGRTIVWLETAGVLESGNGLQGTFSLAGLGPGLVVNAGFTAGGLLRYRASQFFALDDAQNRDELVKQHATVKYPRTAVDAKLMPFGTEVEITGQGKVAGNATLAAVYGATVGPATAGVGFSVTASGEVDGEVSVKISALDGYKRVRVTIRLFDLETAKINAQLRAGLIFQPGSLQPSWPSIGLGLLKYLVMTLGYTTIEELVNAYTTITAKLEHLSARQDTFMFAYDFDLEHPKGQAAFENAARLSVALAEDYAKAGDSGVVKVVSRETQSGSSDQFDITAFGTKLYLAQRLQSERSGSLEINGQTTLLYRTSLFREHYENWFTGSKKDIQWESICTQNPTISTQDAPYFRFHYSEIRNRIKSNQTQKFLQFTRSMGIPDQELAELSAQNISNLSKTKDLKTDIDVYFTHDGLEHINQADAKTAYMAFLQASSEMEMESKPISIRAKNLMAEIRNMKNAPTWSICADCMTASKLANKYEELTGRNFHSDEKVVIEAEEFGKAIDKITNARDAQQAADFFTGLGKSKGLSFMASISALRKLATPQDTLVHSMSLGGGGITLKGQDQGYIEHPREQVMDVLTRVV